MRRHTAVWLLAVAVLAMALFAGCGKSKEAETTQPQAQMPGAYSQQPGAYRGPRLGPQLGAYPGAYGQQQMQPAAAQPAEPEEVEPAGPSYQERYKQGELTAEELRQEYELQQVERELGYPVGPE